MSYFRGVDGIKRSALFLADFNELYGWYEVEGVGRVLLRYSEVKDDG